MDENFETEFGDNQNALLRRRSKKESSFKSLTNVTTLRNPSSDPERVVQ